MTIPALPSLDRTSPTFKADLDTFFLTQLPDTVDALNSEITRIDGILPAGYVATSTTSLTVASSGTISLTVQTNKGFAPGQFVVISVTADPATQMGGTVTAYDYTTGALSVSVSQSAGSGTYAAWTVSISTASASPYSVGDIALTNRALSAPAWLPANGGIYSQSSYAALYAELGLLRDGVYQPQITGATLGAGTFAPANCAPLVHNSTLYLYSWASSTSSHVLNRTTDGATISGSAALTNTAAASAYLGVAAIGTTMLALPPSGNAFVSRSTDSGATFSSQPVSGLTGQTRIMVIGGLFCIFSGTTAYWTSPDGLVWTSRTLPATLVQFTSGNGIAIGCTNTSTSTIYTTSDAITWTARTMPSTAAWQAIDTHYNAASNTWLCYASATAWARSADNGATWSAVTPFAGSTLPALYYVDRSAIRVFAGKFVVSTQSSDGGSIVASVDGATWSAIEAPPWELSGVSGSFAYSAMYVVGQDLYISNNTFQVWTTTDLVRWYRLPTLGSQYLSAYWRFGYEVGTTQVFVQQSDNVLRRKPLYTYNSATQFAVPAVPAPMGVTAYIKA